jgi:hypothetical protein
MGWSALKDRIDDNPERILDEKAYLKRRYLQRVVYA